MNVICYLRVSTDEQANQGYSLRFQQQRLQQHCELHNYNIVGEYTEDYSAKTFDRPEWKKLITYVKQNKKKVDSILVLRWDRFSRNQYESMTVIKQLAKLGTTVNAIEQPLDLTNPDNKVLLALYLTMPEVENDKISKRTKDGMFKAQLEGCWTAFAPKGYKNHRDDDKKSTLRPNEDAPLIKDAFERMATGSYSADEVRRWLNDKGLSIGKQTFLNVIRAPVYLGKIQIKPYMDDPLQIVEGLHPAIVSPETFYRANEVLSGRVRNMKFHEDKTDIYPLKGFMTCPVHNKAITAYGARGRLGDLHHYYLCVDSKECGQRHRIEDVHQSIEDILSKIQLSAQTVMLYKAMLKKLFEKNDYIRLDEIDKTEKEIDKLNQRITNLQDQLMDGEIAPNDFHPMKERTENTLTGLQLKLKNLKATTSPFKTFINKEVPMLENIAEYYKNSDGKTKKKILGCIFSKKMVLEKGKVATYEFTKPIQVLLNASKVFKNLDKKKEDENDLLSCLAPQVGLIIYYHNFFQCTIIYYISVHYALFDIL